MKLLLKTMCGATKVVEHYDPYHYQCHTHAYEPGHFHPNGYVRPGGSIRSFVWIDGQYEWGYDQDGFRWYCPVLHEQPGDHDFAARERVRSLEAERAHAEAAYNDLTIRYQKLEHELAELKAPRPSRHDTVLDIAARMKR